MTTTTFYKPTRPIATAAELDEHRIGEHGRAHGIASDGFDDMELTHKEGWRTRASWGRNGWDLGGWPYVSFQLRDHDGRFELQQIVEGDHTQWAFDTDADREAAIDYLFLWYAAGEDWAPLTPDDREALDAGTLTIDVQFRGPTRPAEWPSL